MYRYTNVIPVTLLPEEYNNRTNKIIYHGSDHAVPTPSYGIGNIHNDYGLGFYCTENANMAKEWGVREGRNGYANRYEIDMDGLSVLNLSNVKSTMMEWLTILLENRTVDDISLLMREAKEYIRQNFLPPYRDYDIIIGCRANDSYFSFASDFMNGVILYRVLSEAMKLGKKGEQIVAQEASALSASRA